MKRTQIILFFILIFGAFLRLYRIDVKMRFIWDEGRDMMAIRRMIITRHPTLFGPYNEIDGRADFFGVLHYYLMAPALLLANFDPLGPSVFTALLGIGSIALVYMLIKQWSGEKTALVVSALYAVTPGVVRYVQWAWNPNTAPFFALLFFLSITQLNKTMKLRFSAISGLLLGILVQLHYFTIALGVAWLTVALLKKTSRKVFAVHSFVFLTGFVLPNLSFVLFDVTHEHFYLHILQRSFIHGGKQQLFQPSLFSLLTVPFQFLATMFEEVFSAPTFIAVFFSVVFLILLVRSVVILYRKKEITLSALFAVSWIAFFLQIAVFPKTFDAYHSASLWVGVLYMFVEPMMKKKWKYTIAVIAIVFVSFLYNNNINRKPQWSENMPKVRALSFLATNDAKSQHESFNVASFTDSDTRATRYRYFFDVAGVKPLDVFSYPQAQHLYIITPHTYAETLQNPAWELDAFRRGKETHLGEVGEVSVYRVDR